MLPKSVQLLKFVKGPRVLDVGCAGHFVEPESPHWLHEQFVRHFPEVMSIDLSSENVENLRSYGYSNASVANAETLSRGALFDTIVVGKVIEHLTNPGFFCYRRETISRRAGGFSVDSFSLQLLVFPVWTFHLSKDMPESRIYVLVLHCDDYRDQHGQRDCNLNRKEELEQRDGDERLAETEDRAHERVDEHDNKNFNGQQAHGCL